MGRLDAAVVGMLDSLLSSDGRAFTYSRGSQSISITLYQRNSPAIRDNGDGMVIEETLESFRGKASDMGSLGEPQRFDKITDGTQMFEVQPVGDKVFYVVHGLLHIHAKQVHA